MAIWGLEMDEDDTRVLKVISKRKVITIEVLSSLLSSSIKTARRRLRLWQAYLRRRPKLPRFVLIKKGTTWCAGVFHREGLRLAVGMRDWWERRWVY